ncbi:FtsX-like permease family protein [Dyadobacter sp. CY312]|uniref:ABC transporter permease n=1 Tax=Dyadobacter sp. CY312 TaxID=2907303 RepID=UPI001F1F3C93|nr:FtsX-like permease family protein [Dyadobacter sp. CY312]MCE7043167.1 ABC transporter permease [Dyadobacter sp. CY312]
MFANNLKVAFRNIRKHKVFSFINIFGLGVGMAASFIILQYVVHELSYDRFHENGDRIFQIQSYNPAEDHDFVWTQFEPEFAPYLKETDPAIVNYVRVRGGNEALIKNATKPDGPQKKQTIAFADTSFFSVFTFPLVRGNPVTVLSKPMTVVISERIAEQYFGDQDPVGQKLAYKGKDLYYYDEGKNDEPSVKGQTALLEVSGVMKNMVSNSSIEYDLISSVATGLKLDTTIALPNYDIYLMLGPGKSPENVLKKLPAARKFLSGGKESYMFYNAEDKYKLQSLYKLHIGESGSNNTTVKVFFGIAIAVLLLALFNYINLTTARAVVRAKEVGLRKTLGVSRLSLFGQFFSESLLITMLAFLLAAVLTIAGRKSFNGLLGFDISISIFKDGYFISSVILVLIGTALLAGIYPSFVLASFSPAKVLRGNLAFGNNSSLIRRAFIIVQFAISTSLILGSVVVNKQVTYMKNKNPGYNKEQLVNINLVGKVSRKSSIIKQDLKSRYGFENVSTSANPLLLYFNGVSHYNPVKKVQVTMFTNWVDEDFIENVGMKMVVPLDRNVAATNGYYYVVNETAIKELGLTKENAVGKQLFSTKNVPMGKIAGVIQNYDFMGPKVKSGIFMFQVHDGKQTRNLMSSLQVRLNPEDNKQEKIALLEKIYKQYEPEKAFSYSFVDEDFNTLFHEDLRTSKLITVFMGIGVFLACLGLFGLVTFITQTRVKEIGIRKVLGASVLSVVGMLSFEFAKLVFIAIVIGLALSYYATDQWLQDFVYRTQIGWPVYFLVGLISIFIALLTVSIQSLRAALLNPVKSLKSD